jgi:2-keto-4-pentenoate hydratase/2-oxohepta-3-ene-1,7-dioic acid hydratase in catechol pathway
MKISTVDYHGRIRSGIVKDGPEGHQIEFFVGDSDPPWAFGPGELENVGRERAMPLSSFRVLPPVPKPGKLLCLAGNYREHIVESGYAAPEMEDVLTQQVFLKPSTCLIGDGAEIPIGANNVAVGWEVELAVVIGRGGRDIAANDALDHVFGYTILNDISERKLNSRLTNRKKRELDVFFDWLAGKWFDGFAPCGPWIVTADEIPDPHNLGIRLFVNGELRQEAITRAMIFDIPAQIEYASSITRLEPGDIISTGTPAGAGLGSGSKALKNGDEVVCEIDSIGTLRNRVREAA